jgi:hypothetical protein
MSVTVINRFIFGNIHQILKNALFHIIIAFIAFFTYKTLIEIFWVYGLNASRDFRVAVYRIMTYINLFANIVYTLAVIWMPRKAEYTLQ